MPTANAYMSYLAELAKSSTRNRWNVLSGTNFEDLGWATNLAFQGESGASTQQTIRGSARVKRLHRLDRLHATEGLLRIGWLWLVGETTIDGKTTKVCTPLTSLPVSLTRIATNYLANPQSSLESASWLRGPAVSTPVPSPGISGTEMNPALFDRLTNLKDWAARSVSQSGLPRPVVLYDPQGIEKYRTANKLTVVATAVLYLERDIDAPDMYSTLKAWSSLPLAGTAFANLYTETASATRPARQTATAALPLNPPQLRAMQHAAEHQLTVISGPPGTGKSHVVAALAVDQIARGNTVLIATQSRHAADVIERTLDRFPSPRFVRFGKQESRHRAAQTLSEMRSDSESEGEARKTYVTASGRAAALRNQLLRLVTIEQGLGASGSLILTPTPGFEMPTTDLIRAGELVRRLSEGRLWTRLIRNSLERELRTMAGAPLASLDEISIGLETAVADRQMDDVRSQGGVTLEDTWRNYLMAEAAELRAAAVWVQAVAEANANRRSRRTAAEVGSVLRAGAGSRRRLLRDVSSEHLLNAFPLWIGTLAETDTTLPADPAMFDVVIFDEASHINQLNAAPALARAARAVVVGDPRQLRHVSFTSDDAMATAAHRVLDEAPGVADIRRNSLYDLAASRQASIFLTEHFRSTPHIADFPNRKFYGRRLEILTRHPRNHSLDSIDITRVNDQRDQTGVIRDEVEVARRIVRRLVDQDRGTIAVISPFRAQADALEEMLLQELTDDEIEHSGVRTGTVHGIQGDEADTVIISLGLDADAPAGSTSFIEDAHLFNVMVTRARRAIHIVTAVDPAGLRRGLLSDYLRHEAAPPAAPPAGVASPWAQDVADSLAGYGVPSIQTYVVGPHVIDLAVGEGDRAIAVECHPHADGAQAHLHRRQALSRVGWVIVDAFPSRWVLDADGAALHIKSLYESR